MKGNRLPVLMLMLVAATAVVCLPYLHWNYRLLYNPSDSAPRGWYFVKPSTEVHVNDYVVVRLPDAVANFAAQRKYLPSTIPLLKHVSALGGEKVCAIDGFLSLNHRVVVRALTRDGAGRPLVAWTGCRALAADEVLLLSATSDASFDSRYFGPVPRNRLIGRAIPLWTWP